MKARTKDVSRIGMVSLGCTKNLVDSEVMLGLLKQAGYAVTPRAEEADIILINTCSFIESAKRETIETIIEMSQMKHEGKCRFLIVTGCLAQEYGTKLLSEIPEIDAFVGPGELTQIVSVIQKLESSHTQATIHCLKETAFIYDHTFPRLHTTWPHLGYIKISEGCNHCCSYCLIPRLRGPYRSREIDSILIEAKYLVNQGVKEICLVGQDTTAFKRIHLLLEKLASLKGAPWIRLLYTYPFSVDVELIKVMANYPNILHYLDIPLQHSHPKVLKAMNRPSDMQKTEALINFARSAIPDLTIRTTFMVGFPGETDEEFEDLLDFVEKIRFDRLGVFAYSKERGTLAYHLPAHVPKRIKEERYRQIMTLQAAISKEKNQALLGKALEVICDYPDPHQEGMMIGRTKGQAPQIDGVTYIRGENLKPGERYRVEVTKAGVYDLEGERIK
jgi:ribosomal protein S12 methylthiotransferase